MTRKFLPNPQEFDAYSAMLELVRNATTEENIAACFTDFHAARSILSPREAARLAAELVYRKAQIAGRL